MIYIQNIFLKRRIFWLKMKAITEQVYITEKLKKLFKYDWVDEILFLHKINDFEIIIMI
jgi:hypothetical protein